ncbi:MAG: DNA topoisomerase 1 [Syntrophomonadaceae bacterium]|nr:DNA topoisomerase 1 [Bacillota bacterium]
MSDYLVIVESPAKANTIKKYLGRKFRVMASKGHCMDLPKSQFGIDLQNNFEPKYITIRGKGALLKELRAAGKEAKRIFLAADPDREGEAICWHLAKLLGLAEDEACRVEFHEITESAVLQAFKEPRSLSRAMVDAQVCRRVLDRIVGYKISPLLWKKIRKGLSAGRVQSVALRLIVDREKEIGHFQPAEYWTLTVRLDAGNFEFSANYFGRKGKKHIPATSEEINSLLDNLRDKAFLVTSVKQKSRRRMPAPPFTTSSLQQEASRKLGFTSRRTMMVAQQLYEGLPLEDGIVGGLVTYIRTDATRIAQAAQTEARQFIAREFGKDYLPAKPPVYAGKKSAQAAHEAIRPTDVRRTPEQIKAILSRDQYRLYKLIWERFLASQMSAAVYDLVEVDIAAGDYQFRAAGSQVLFDGFIKLYTEGQDEEEAAGKTLRVNQETDGLTPVFACSLSGLVAGQALTVLGLKPMQHFTQPPSRYSEAMLIKALEEKGIGRPSTYAPTVETLLTRGYVVRENKIFSPTELGSIVLELLMEFFSGILNVDFTAEMEEKLDHVAAGGLSWVEVIREFYEGFTKDLKAAEERMEKIELVPDVSDEPCPNCGKLLVRKLGRFGHFLACPGFPGCRFAKPIVRETEASCPECGKTLVERRSKRGRKFFGCSGYPSCKFTTWDVPQKEKCPSCGYLTVKKGNLWRCASKECSQVLYERQSKRTGQSQPLPEKTGTKPAGRDAE